MIDRIKQLLEWQQLSPTQFADRIGVGRPVVSHILSERNKPSLDVVQRIIAAFPNLSLPWLLSGSGEMLVSTAPVTSAPSTSTPAVASPAIIPAATENVAATLSTVPERTRPAGISAEPPPVPTQRYPATGAGPGRFRAGAEPRAAEPATTRFVANAAKPLPTEESLAQPVEVPDSFPLPPAAPAVPPAKVPNPEPLVTSEARPADLPAPSLPTITEAAELAQVMGESLGAPGKTIRRIVLFYTDGSFADFKPE